MFEVFLYRRGSPIPPPPTCGTGGPPMGVNQGHGKSKTGIIKDKLKRRTKRKTAKKAKKRNRG